MKPRLLLPVPAEDNRLARLRRLERLRTAERINAGRMAAEAQSTYARLHALARRSADLASDYTAPSNAVEGAALQRLRLFRAGLDQLSQKAAGESAMARQHADRRNDELVQATRRLDKAAEQTGAAVRAAAYEKNEQDVPLSADLARSLNSRRRTRGS
ncbi:hypothetical protein RM533_00655 [Croceicoccus sp. F390]|uniref:Flagellar FliJ protein n=1 Tax=Croceicoccus esteveae TaxID=3075597 RepID=A0ABU2ZDL1_9SPHN|nr:hypothetical protein [Croceicoccus sp. F390]MDT0574687.1 hypothetical protein [Croceicoccus sp. F390]